MTFLNLPITIFATYDAAKKIAEANQEGDDVTEYRVTEREDGRFVIAMFEDGEFQMCL